jgi:hypothetical protein
MERHVERLIASCGLAQFSYRTWPGAEIAAPVAPRAVAATEPASPTPTSSLHVVAAPPPEQADAAPVEPGPANDAPAAARARTLLASLSRFIEDPQAIPPAASAAQRPTRPRGPLSLPPAEGFEAPIHVGYRSPKAFRDRRAPQASPGPDPAASTAGPAGKAGAETARTRRFALLDEMLPAPLRPVERRNPPGPFTP